MSKLFKHTAFRGLHYILIISLVCVPFTGIACDDCFCECYDEEEFVNYHELGEYEDMYREFEIQAELEEMDLKENKKNRSSEKIVFYSQDDSSFGLIG